MSQFSSLLLNIDDETLAETLEVPFHPVFDRGQSQTRVVDLGDRCQLVNGKLATDQLVYVVALVALVAIGLAGYWFSGNPVSPRILVSVAAILVLLVTCFVVAWQRQDQPVVEIRKPGRLELEDATQFSPFEVLAVVSTTGVGSVESTTTTGTGIRGHVYRVGLLIREDETTIWRLGLLDCDNGFIAKRICRELAEGSGVAGIAKTFGAPPSMIVHPRPIDTAAHGPSIPAVLLYHRHSMPRHARA